jgi:beta-exotoxin I transport system ATP-binding protein
MNEPAILTQDLTKFYGVHRGVEGIDLQVKQGEVFGFLGPNGAGKTTTIRLLLDLLRPTRGRSEVLGLDCRAQSLKVRRSIGYLPSEYRLYENLNGRKMLSFLGGLGAEIDWAFVHEMAERLGIDLDRSIRTLSHGNKQKLAIILAFMHKAQVLILDEPTSGLDPLVQQEFFALVDEARQEGRTVFLSSHNLTEVERVCDRVASVREGRLIAIDQITDIRSSALRVVELTCRRALSPEIFAHLEGVGDLDIEGSTLRCHIQGALGALVAAAAPYDIVDILSREPSLEEFFLAMYGRQEVRDAV